MGLEEIEVSAAVHLAFDELQLADLPFRRTAMSLSAHPEHLGANSVLLDQVIDPTARRAGETFLANLDAITVEQMCDTAEKTQVLNDEKVGAA